MSAPAAAPPALLVFDSGASALRDALLPVLEAEGRPAAPLPAFAPGRPAREAFARLGLAGELLRNPDGGFSLALRRVAAPARDALAAAAFPVEPPAARDALAAALALPALPVTEPARPPGPGDAAVPAWRCLGCGGLRFDFDEPPAPGASCPACGGGALERAPGRVDPAFAAALAPFAALGWPDTESPALRDGYPATLGLATPAGIGRAARALLLGLKFMGLPPCRALVVASAPDRAFLAAALRHLAEGDG